MANTNPEIVKKVDMFVTKKNNIKINL